MIETMLPVHCHKWHSIIIVKQESTISIYGLLHFLSHFLSFRQGGHTADWNYSRPSKTDTSTIFTSKSKSVLTCFSNFLSDKHGFYFPSALTLSPGLRTLLLESRLVCPLLPLPLTSPPQLWMVQQIFLKCNTKNQLAFSVVCQEIHSIRIFQ